jgi:hypothetical protein
MSVLVLRPDGAPSRDADRAVQADSAFLDRASNREWEILEGSPHTTLAEDVQLATQQHAGTL